MKPLYIHPKFQGMGIGKTLLRYIKKNVAEKSWLMTWVHNHKAIQFYTKNGYEIIEEAEFRLFDESHKNHVLSNS